MQKIVSNGERAATVILDGGECEVIFGSRYNVFSVTSDEDVLLALESGRTEGEDGTLICKGGESVMYPHMRSLDRLFITGSGRVQIVASNVAANPFKKLRKGGEANGSILIPHQENCRHLYYADENPLGASGWKDLAGDTDMNAPAAVNSDGSVSFESSHIVPYEDDFLCCYFTQYLLCGFDESFTDSGWWGVFNTSGSSAPTVDVCSYQKCFAIGAGASGYDIRSSVSVYGYSAVTVTNDYGYVRFYIDGVLIGERYGYNKALLPQRYVCGTPLKLYSAALFDVPHNAETVAEVSGFLREKFLG